MNKWTEILVGLILIVAVVLMAFYFPSWFSDAITVLKGGLMWMVLGIGLLFVMLGISELKD